MLINFNIKFLKDRIKGVLYKINLTLLICKKLKGVINFKGVTCKIKIIIFTI